MGIKIVAFVACIVIAIVSLARADFPVHCLWSDSLAGDSWIISSTSLNMNQEQALSTCGVRRSMPFPQKRYVKFSLPNTAQDDQGNTGTFNIFYDQGFQLKIDGLIHLVSFNFTTEGGKTTSYCHETLTGLVRSEDNSRFGCFRAQRSTSRKSINVVDLPTISEEKFDNSQSFVNSLNQAQQSWTAANHEFLNGKTLKEVQKMAGRPTTAFIRANTKRHLKAVHEEQKLSEVEYQQELKKRGIPKSWDWRDVNGKSYVSPIRNQGSCGSCYSFATTAVVESRWLQAGNSVQQFSPQDVLSCTNTNNPDGSYNSNWGFSNGCNGGFAFSLFQYGETVGFNTEECYKYTAKETQTCSPKCNDRVKTKNHHYVGKGYMGGATELDIMEALYREGPMSINIQVYRDFLHYKSGVYHHVEGMNDSPQEWIEANHLVQLVGYTEVDGQKAWILKNSWGPNWGVNGFGYILRGNSIPGGEIAIRSAVVGAELA